MRCDRLWRNARLATMVGGGLGLVEAGLIAATDGKIVFVGPETEAPPLDAAESVDCQGRLITPGLIDPHTHLVFGGDRASEFERRLDGESYADIARSGGGILSTVRATRAADAETLLAGALERLDELMAQGVTTVEIKSGYGLELDTETRMLRVARRLGEERAVTIRTSFLGAHTIPPEYRDDRKAYIDLLTQKMIPALAAAGLADAVDAFCEDIAFSAGEIRQVFAAAAACGLPVKLHAEQLSNQGGAALAAEFGALSADHLEHLDAAGVAILAKAGTVATLLPGAFYFTRETQAPPIAALRAAGVPVALATDCNPGTSPLTSPLLVMNLAATLWRMTVPECLAGVTCNAARALGLNAEIGSLETG
ncbi:MAG TPA: imidazolonepropionase, partial [Caulobacteraceae bacterium]